MQNKAGNYYQQLSQVERMMPSNAPKKTPKAYKPNAVQTALAFLRGKKI